MSSVPVADAFGMFTSTRWPLLSTGVATVAVVGCLALALNGSGEGVTAPEGPAGVVKQSATWH